MNELLQQKRKDGDEDIIDLRPLLAALGKRWFIILLTAALFGAAAWFGSHLLLTPTYKTNCRVYVNNMLDSSDKTSVSSSDLSASRSLAYTYAEIIRGRSVLEEAAQRIGLYSTYSDVEYLVSVSTSSSTEIITVSVESSSPEVSRDLCSSIVEVAEIQVANIVDGSSMRVIDKPFLPKDINSPNYKKNAVIGAAIGILIAATIIILRVLLDNLVRDEDILEKRFGIVILGSIPSFEDARKAGNNYYSYGYAKANSEVKV